MHQFSFQSGDPADHVCRALDVARKMGFQLARLSVEPTVANSFAISLTVDKGTPPAVETLLARLALMVGAHDIKCATTRAAQAQGPH